jgi:hypothetical protein
VTLQIIRDWALKFNAHEPDGTLSNQMLSTAGRQPGIPVDVRPIPSKAADDLHHQLSSARTGS